MTVRAWILSSRAEKEAVSAGSSALFFVAMRLGEDLGQADVERRVREAERTISELKPLLEKASDNRANQNADAEKR